jgi:hypothetical protein
MRVREILGRSPVQIALDVGIFFKGLDRVLEIVGGLLLFLVKPEPILEKIIYVQWERGRASPSEPNRKALVSLRKRGRREVRRLLEHVANRTGTRQRTAFTRTRSRGRRGGR